MTKLKQPDSRQKAANTLERLSKMEEVKSVI